MTAQNETKTPIHELLGKLRSFPMFVLPPGNVQWMRTNKVEPLCLQAADELSEALERAEMAEKDLDAIILRFSGALLRCWNEDVNDEDVKLVELIKEIKDHAYYSHLIRAFVTVDKPWPKGEA